MPRKKKSDPDPTPSVSQGAIDDYVERNSTSNRWANDNLKRAVEIQIETTGKLPPEVKSKPEKTIRQKAWYEIW